VCWHRLERSNVFRLEAFGPLGDVKFDRLAFLQAAKAACLDSRKMHENVVARLTADQAEAFGVVKPFHCSLFHCVTCFYCGFLLRRFAACDKGWRWLAGPTFNCWANQTYLIFITCATQGRPLIRSMEADRQTNHHHA